LEGTNNYSKKKNHKKLPKKKKKTLKRRAQKKLRTKQNFQKSPKNAELEGTINTPSEGTNIMRKTKTFENLQKIAELEGTIHTPPFAPLFNLVIYTTMDTWQGCDDLSLLRPDP
jgi:hypothetical protein